MKKIFLLSILLASSSAFLVGCASHPGTSSQSQAAANCLEANGDASAYRLGSGDVLQISVWNDKDLQRTLTIRPDGMISFPLLNDIPAAGLTAMQLQNKITSGLQQYMTNPQVSVVVQAVKSFTVSVLGEVQKPGRYEMHSGRATVLDALAMAGGLTPYADRADIHLLRDRANGDAQQIPFHYGKAVSMNPGYADFCVNPGDIIIVP